MRKPHPLNLASKKPEPAAVGTTPGRNAVLLHTESAEAYEELRQSYYRSFAPVDQPEADLVDQMIAATWKIRRLCALESAAIDHAIDAQRTSIDATYVNLDPETRAHFGFEMVADSPAFVLYRRLESAQSRNFSRALRLLLKLRHNARLPQTPSAGQ